MAVGTQSERALISNADGIMLPLRGLPDADLSPDPPAASDVLGIGSLGAVAAEAGHGKTIVAVGDGAVRRRSRPPGSSVPSR